MRKIIILLVAFSLVAAAWAIAGENKSAGPVPTPKKNKPAYSAQQYFSLARESFNNDNLKDAIFNCRMAISIKPDFLDAHYMLGKAYLISAAKANRLSIRDFGVSSPETRYLKQYVKGRAELKKAIRHFSASLNLEPEDIDAMLNLGIAQDNLGMEKDAIKSYEKTIEMDPVSTQARDAYNNLGLVLISEKRFKEAKIAYEKAISIDPNFVPAKLNLQRLQKLKPKLK